ncbi:MAG: hypothetical protein K2Y18_04175 [Alphaproteobacteria bacterium]|jgi:hypothetical protein|nr:hypothetical protein [Alphaproteobacteria bacterium]
MKNLFRSLFIALLALGLNPTGAMEKYEAVRIQDCNGCLVRKISRFNGTEWQVHDPKIDNHGEYNALVALTPATIVPSVNGMFNIDKIEFSAQNESKVRALNAFFNGLNVDNSYTFHTSPIISVRVENVPLPADHVKRPGDRLGEDFPNTILGLTLTAHFGFKGSANSGATQEAPKAEASKEESKVEAPKAKATGGWMTVEKKVLLGKLKY